MKKVLFLCFMMCFFFSSYGQDKDEFIEVMVEDSMQVEPEEIFYMVMLASVHTAFDTIYIENTPPVRIKPDIEESKTEKLYKLIARMKLDTVALKEFNITTNEYREAEKTIVLHFRSKTKLQEFIKEVKKIQGLTGSIASVKHSKIEIYEQQLTKKLLSKAKSNATFIAEHSGKKAGRILQVREEQPDEAHGGWTMYPPLSALSQANYPQLSDKIILTKKLLVRYAW